MHSSQAVWSFVPQKHGHHCTSLQHSKTKASMLGNFSGCAKQLSMSGLNFRNRGACSCAGQAN